MGFRALKSLVRIFLLISLVSGMLIIISANIKFVQATDVPSIINSNTIWTKTDSPYELKGPVLVNNGVILTIEPGTTVNLYNYYIQIDGTLIAKGNDSERITFNGGKIVFSESSSNWNEETNSGCIIENSDLSSSEINIANSPKISKNFVLNLNIGGSPTVSNNTITGKLSIGGSPIILENTVTNALPNSVSISGSPLISNNTLNCRILVTQGFPKISDNILKDGIHVDASGGSVEIISNVIDIRGDYNVVHVQAIPAIILNNVITGNGKQTGIYAFYSDNFNISGNTVSDCLTGINARFYGTLTVEHNEVKNNIDGIYVAYYKPHYVIGTPNSSALIRNNYIIGNSGKGVAQHHASATILNNSITNNNVGIEIFQPTTVVYNNIYSNQYNLKLGISEDVNATLNWWGTTDIAEINQTLYDLKYDFNLGSITFTPFLTTLNKEATPKITIPEFPLLTILPLFLVATLSALVIKKRLFHNY
ncbi:MAG: right-handed parallel beta-helix repeat-containing protein [Candidatus Bathyarchaeota archaeon]